MSPSDPGDVVRVDVALVEDPIHVSVTAYQGIPGPPGPPGVDGVDGVDGAPGPPGPSGAVAHAPTHNTGGTDPITALSAAVLTTGTIPNARLAADVLIAGSVSIGGFPASTGAIRLGAPDTADNSSSIIARNVTGTGDLKIVHVWTDNRILIGSLTGDGGLVLRSAAKIEALAPVTAPSVAIGTNPAQSGAVRLASGGAMHARRSSNAADANLIELQANDNLVVGDAALECYVHGTIVSLPSVVTVGSNTAQAGALNLPNPGTIYARNATNTADIDVINAYVDNKVYIGSGTADAGLVLRSAIGVEITPRVQLTEATAPAAPAVNKANLWLEDNGAGKSRLMIQFATGAAIAIATQA